MKNGTFFHTDNTETLVKELKSVKTALETVAGRRTSTSLLLGKAISHICLLDAKVYHAEEDLKVLEEACDMEEGYVFEISSKGTRRIR